MSCSKGTPLPSIEDMFAGNDLPDELVQKYQLMIKDMLEDIDISSDKDFDKFKTLEQRKYKVAIKNAYFLQVYRKMVKENIIKRSEFHEQFMRTKKQRGEEGVIVVTLVTSPWPKTVEDDYGLDVEGDVHKSDIFIKPDLVCKSI